VNEARAMFWRRSVAEHSTVVTPTGKRLADCGEQNGASRPSTRSVAEARNFTTAPFRFVVRALSVPGTTSRGGVRSATVTRKLFVATSSGRS
jgi:hypothetical protein